MTVVFDTSTALTPGTGNMSGTHTPLILLPRAAAVYVVQTGAIDDQVSGVTYGGIPLEEALGSPHLIDLGDEPGVIYAYRLGSGLPSGAQTVEVTVTGGAQKWAVVITMDAIGDVDSEGQAVLNDVIEDPSLIIETATMSEPFVIAAAYTGHDAPSSIVQGSNYTSLHSRDFGTTAATVVRRNTNPSGGDVTVSFTQTIEDIGIFALAFSELTPSPLPETAGTNKEAFVLAHARLIDYGFELTDDDISVGFGLSGHGPLADYISGTLAAYMRVKSGSDDSPRIFMQANGWGPNGEWGATATTEAQFDANVWGHAVKRGLQDIHPANAGDRTAANWITMYDNADLVEATYTEIYHAQFSTNLTTAFQADAAARNQMIAEIDSFYISRTSTGGGGTDPDPDPDPVTTLGALYKITPFHELWTHMRSAASGGVANNNDAFAATMARYYARNVHAEGQHSTYLGDNTKASSGDLTLARRLRNAGVDWVTGYENGSYTHQGDFAQAGQAESECPLGLATLWPGSYLASGSAVTDFVSRLTISRSATVTTIFINSAIAVKPGAAPNVWPFKDSRGLGAINTNSRSQSTTAYVGWLRIDNEIIGIPAGGLSYDAGGDDIVITGAIRGMFGTTPASHAQNARVFSPVYIGIVAGADAPLSGVPDDVDGGGAAKPLRYAYKVWNGAAADHIAKHSETKFDMADTVNPWGGYNCVHNDVSTGALYNQGDPYGLVQVRQWYDPGGRKASDGDWADGQIFKHTRELSRSGWANIGIIANSPERFGDDQRVVSNLATLRPGTGGRWEGWGKEFGGDTWIDPTFSTWLNRAIAIYRDNEPMFFWNRWDREFSGTGNATEEARYLRVSYAMALLAYQAGKTGPCFGAPWGLVRPDNCLFWHLGTPSSNPFDAAALLDSATGLYVRRFVNGLVLVNATTSSKNWNLSSTYHFYRVASSATGNDVTPTSAAEVSGSISVPARDCVILARILA